VLCGRTLAEGNVEIERRKDGAKELVPLAEATAWVAKAVEAERGGAG
jgi:hypothetical protein